MVSVETIKSVIVDQENDLKRQLSAGVVERELRIDEKKLASGVVGVITGIRRCGKSVLAQMTFSGKEFGSINFEDARMTMTAAELNSVLEAIYSLKGPVNNLVLDEIQNVEGWERFIGRLASSKKVLVTGSNARLASKELATYLVGRHIDFELFPFSFREFLLHKGVSLGKEQRYATEVKAMVIRLLREYMEIGGMPQAYSLGGGYLATLYTEILERDIAQRHGIRHVQELKGLANYLASCFAAEMSANRLKGVASMKTANTISKWISYLEESYLFFKLERFSSKLKERIKAPKKVYMMDTGILCSIYADASNSKGRLMENLVAIELRRKIAYWQNGYELYYWKGVAQEEVDFVLRKGGKTSALIQVTYASNRNEIKDRELKSLLKASADQKCDGLILITWDYGDDITVEGKRIRCMPLWRWLVDYTTDIV
jgi:hypothetical protein